MALLRSRATEASLRLNHRMNEAIEAYAHELKAHLASQLAAALEQAFELSYGVWKARYGQACRDSQALLHKVRQQQADLRQPGKALAAFLELARTEQEYYD